MKITDYSCQFAFGLALSFLTLTGEYVSWFGKKTLNKLWQSRVIRDETESGIESVELWETELTLSCFLVMK